MDYYAVKQIILFFTIQHNTSRLIFIFECIEVSENVNVILVPSRKRNRLTDKNSIFASLSNFQYVIYRNNF